MAKEILIPNRLELLKELKDHYLKQIVDLDCQLLSLQRLELTEKIKNPDINRGITAIRAQREAVYRLAEVIIDEIADEQGTD